MTHGRYYSLQMRCTPVGSWVSVVGRWKGKDQFGSYYSDENCTATAGVGGTCDDDDDDLDAITSKLKNVTGSGDGGCGCSGD
jgi:hypothetical protein